MKEIGRNLKTRLKEHIRADKNGNVRHSAVAEHALSIKLIVNFA